jgi:hypothetical protein
VKEIEKGSKSNCEKDMLISALLEVLRHDKGQGGRYVALAMYMLSIQAV